MRNFLTNRSVESLQLGFWARIWSFNFFVSDDGNDVLSCPALLPKVPPLADRAPGEDLLKVAEMPGRTLFLNRTVATHPQVRYTLTVLTSTRYPQVTARRRS